MQHDRQWNMCNLILNKLPSMKVWNQCVIKQHLALIKFCTPACRFCPLSHTGHTLGYCTVGPVWHYCKCEQLAWHARLPQTRIQYIGFHWCWMLIESRLEASQVGTSCLLLTTSFSNHSMLIQLPWWSVSTAACTTLMLTSMILSSLCMM